MEQGKCPKCEKDLEYAGGFELEGEQLGYSAFCECGWRGKEWYSLTFIDFTTDDSESKIADLSLTYLSEDVCILCQGNFTVGVDGNELGFCSTCQNKPDFPYDLDAYYIAFANDKTTFKGFDTMSRGLLEPFRK